MPELPPDESSIASAGADPGRRKAAAEARGVPETDQLGGKVNRENSLTFRPVQGQRGRPRSRAKGDRIEREIVSRHADSSPRRPVPRSYPVLKPAASQFDYGAIPPSLVPNLQAQAKLIKDMIAKTTAGLIEVGRNLTAVKQQLDHGQFMDWVEIEVGIVKRTAQSYMAIARLADAKGATVALLPPTTAHRLAAISAPVEVVDHVLDRAVNGVIVPDGEVEEMFRNARNQRKQAKKKDRRSRVASASAYRRSEAGRRKEELCRLEREDQRKRSQEEASRIAADLIREIGSTGATRVVALMSSDIADDVLAELRKQLSPDEFDKQPSCEGATAGASA
jgi:hypothetical protein